MTKSRRTVVGRVLATASAATLGLLSMTGVAFAAQGQAGDAPGNVPVDTTGTLNIHKHAGTATSEENPNGTAQTVERPALAGAEFTICQVEGIDLTTEAGWKAAADVTIGNAACKTDTTQVKTTPASGLVSFDGLPIGMYLVKETKAPTGATMAQDFLVTIPYPSKSTVDGTETSTWLWDVHTYPKNIIEAKSDKTVADPSAHGLGAVVPWTITTRPIGYFDGGAKVTTYELVDKLDNNLRYTETTSLKYMVPGGSLATVDSSYYSINPTTSATAPGGQVTVTFNDDGIKWLNGLQAGTYLQWDLKTEVVGVGSLKNEAFENTGSNDVLIGDATTEWGAAKLLKHETNDERKVLKGAEFQVYDYPETGTCPETATGAPLTVSGKAVFTSDENGVVTIPGLYVGKDGTPTSAKYCVYETKAPAGYTISTKAIEINVSKGDVAESTWTAKVANSPTTGPNLPLTGANGTMLLTIGGLALVALAGGAVMVRRSKAHRD